MSDLELQKLISEESQRDSLDLFKPNSNTAKKLAPCKAQDFMIRSEVDEENLFRYFRTFCKSYRCEYCGPRKALLMRFLIFKSLEKYGLKTFATLTLDPRNCAVEESGKYIKSCWNRFRILQKRKFKRGLNYISVLEYQKNGYAHLHILFDSYIDQSWLQQTWVSVAGGSIVDIRRVDQGVVKYLCKYLVKTFIENSGNGLRLISTSQGINLRSLLEKSDLKYNFLKMDQKQARNILKNHIHSEITDRKGFVQGFRSYKPINVT